MYLYLLQILHSTARSLHHDLLGGHTFPLDIGHTRAPPPTFRGHLPRRRRRPPSPPRPPRRPRRPPHCCCRRRYL